MDATLCMLYVCVSVYGSSAKKSMLLRIQEADDHRIYYTWNLIDQNIPQNDNNIYPTYGKS